MGSLDQRLAFVVELVAFGEAKLRLAFDGSFRRYVPRRRSANWLYAVQPLSFTSALPGRGTYAFAWDVVRLRRRERGFQARGMHTYLYSAEAHGGHACPITPSLIAAPRARQAYVVLHEAWHATLRLEGIRMPYALEEATGRAIGVLGAIAFAEAHGDGALAREARAQARAWSAMASFVNLSYVRLDRLYKRGGSARERAALVRDVRREARALRARTASPWEREELGREINNAFLFRYYDYTKLYPLALSVCRSAGSLPAAMRAYKRAGRQGAPALLRAYLRARR